MANSKAKKKPNPKPVTTAKGWKKASSDAEEVELPSGNVALIRRPGLPELMANNIFPDSLTGIAQRAVDQGKSGKNPKLAELESEKAMRDVMGDPQKMADMMDVFDRATSMCVVEPKCVYYKDEQGNPRDSAAREVLAHELGYEAAEDVIWSDEVDLSDKLFIFQFVVGGTRDLERFRGEFGESLAGLERSEDMEV